MLLFSQPPLCFSALHAEMTLEVSGALPPWLEEELQSAFSLYAVADSLPAGSLGPLLRALGQNPTAAEISDTLVAAGLPADAPLTHADVHAILAGKLDASTGGTGGGGVAGAGSVADARAAFECMAGPDGCIGREELARVLDSLGADASAAALDRDAAAMLAAAHAAGGGAAPGSATARIGFAEFIAVLRQTSAASPPPAAVGRKK